jgi:hypothetical protein
MPKELEAKLKRSGKKKGFTSDRLKRYIYGTMNKLGLMKGNKRINKSKYQRNK